MTDSHYSCLIHSVINFTDVDFDTSPRQKNLDAEQSKKAVLKFEIVC